MKMPKNFSDAYSSAITGVLYTLFDGHPVCSEEYELQLGNKYLSRWRDSMREKVGPLDGLFPEMDMHYGRKRRTIYVKVRNPEGGYYDFGLQTDMAGPAPQCGYEYVSDASRFPIEVTDPEDVAPLVEYKATFSKIKALLSEPLKDIVEYAILNCGTRQTLARQPLPIAWMAYKANVLDKDSYRAGRRSAGEQLPYSATDRTVLDFLEPYFVMVIEQAQR